MPLALDERIQLLLDVADDVRDLLEPFALLLDAGPETIHIFLDRLDPRVCPRERIAESFHHRFV